FEAVDVDLWATRHRQSGHVSVALRAAKRLRVFLSFVAPPQFPLRHNVPFHCRIQLTPLRTRGQVQLAIERENLKVIAMRARGWTRSAVTGFPEVICSVDAFGRVSLRDRVGLRRDVPNHPMRKESARRVRVIYHQGQAFRAGRYLCNLQRRTGVTTVTCEL